MAQSAEEYCAQEVRRLDPDRWLTTLFAPDARRPALLALYAFNSEIARAREAVTQPMIGQIRLQWWREAWEGVKEGKPRQQPVVQALYAHCRNLDIADAMTLIDARERDMDAAPMANLAELLGYAEASSAPLMRLAAQALGAELDNNLCEAIRLAGTIYSLVGLLRAVPFLAAQQRIYLPADRLRAAGTEPEALYQKELGAAVFTAAAEVADAAEGLLSQLWDRRIDKTAMPALLPAALARVHLRCLAKAGFDPRKPEASASATRQHMALLTAAWRRRL
ncbi:MAG TPA: squalene/phytoene synthase family protein [Ferrovibrio sp.]|jgi:phytoene synthase|uniref:phytoene/squalene synthase family protein n=1 Tax=Ferrovibrio sp. TaxID=1917215 RepID=UPI002ED2D2A2